MQLYGAEPNLPLINFLKEAGASVSTVAPYVYADKADDDAVRELLHEDGERRGRCHRVHQHAAGRTSRSRSDRSNS